MGLSVKSFDINELKGAKVIGMKIDSANESTVTLQYNKTGTTKRMRIPASLRRVMEFYCDNTVSV